MTEVFIEQPLASPRSARNRLSLQDVLENPESQILFGVSFLHWLRCANPPEPGAAAGASRLGSPTKESGAPQIGGAKNLVVFRPSID